MSIIFSNNKIYGVLPITDIILTERIFEYVEKYNNMIDFSQFEIIEDDSEPLICQEYININKNVLIKRINSKFKIIEGKLIVAQSLINNKSTINVNIIE